jgi:hypothetical protein
MTRNTRWVMGFCVGASFVIGCQPADPGGVGEDGVAEARQAQVPVGPDKDYTIYTFEIASNPLFDLLVIGETRIDDWEPDTEYWFVHTAAVEDIGVEDIEVTSISDDGEPPFLYGDQKFEQPVYLTWNQFTSDPVSAGELYSNGGHHLRLDVYGDQISRIVWYQVINHQSPQNVAPDGTFESVSGSVSIPGGYYGYLIDATIE